MFSIKDLTLGSSSCIQIHLVVPFEKCLNLTGQYLSPAYNTVARRGLTGFRVEVYIFARPNPSGMVLQWGACCI